MRSHSDLRGLAIALLLPLLTAVGCGGGGDAHSSSGQPTAPIHACEGFLDQNWLDAGVWVLHEEPRNCPVSVGLQGAQVEAYFALEAPSRYVAWDIWISAHDGQKFYKAGWPYTWFLYDADTKLAEPSLTWSGATAWRGSVIADSVDIETEISVGGEAHGGIWIDYAISGSGGG